MLAAYEYRGRLVYDRAYEPLVTRVLAVRYRPGADTVEVDAWIPEARRRGVDAPKGAWVGDGVLRTRARIDQNRKSLAPLLASGELEWREE